MASAHLGFDLTAEPLTLAQAKKFHKFVKPVLVKLHERIKDDDKKVAEFSSVYEGTTPSELLGYLLKEEVKASERM